MSIELDDVTSGYNISKINKNFQTVENYINDKLMARADTGAAGESKMERDLDMDGYRILNADLDASSITNDRAVRVPISEGTIPPLPEADIRKGKVLGFDPDDGLPTVFIPASGSAADVLIQLAASNGATLVGNGQDNVQNFLYHTPNEFSGTDQAKITSSVNATNSDGKRTWIYGTRTPSSQVVVPDNVVIQNDGTVTSPLVGTGTGVPTDFIFTLGNKNKLLSGDVNNTGLAGVATVRNKSNVLIQDVSSNGAVTALTPFSYAYDFRDSSNITIRGGVLGNYTGAIGMMNCEKVTIDGLNIHDMFYHAPLTAGGYGVVFGGCNDVTITNMRFKAKDGDNGRHAVYLSTQGGTGNTNTIVSNNIFDWRSKSDAFRGAAVNVRSSVRTLISYNVFDGTTLSGTTDTGTITNCDVVGNSIFAWIYDGQSTHYGINLGDDVGSDFVNGGIVSNNSVVITRKTPTATGTVYGISLSGKNRQCVSNRILVPDNSYPIRVPAGADNILIANNEDLGTTGAQAFILFDGACSNITVSNNRTRRPMFRNVTNVTDLTVDFPRYAQVSATGGVSTITDPDSLISGVSLTSTSMIITFNGHVTQKAVDNIVIDRTLNFSPPVFPVIADRTGKTLTVRFYGINTTQVLLNPTSDGVSCRINLNS